MRLVTSIKRKNSTLSQALGAVITDLRTARSWSQEDLGERAGSKKAYVGRVEKGTQNPTFGLIVNVAAAFGMPASKLLSLAEKRQKSRE